MRSLLAQVLRQVCCSTVELEDLVNDLVKEAEEGAPAIGDAILLARYISLIATQFVRQPLLVIDALDECKDIEELLGALLELANDGVRFFVTSRPLQVIKDSLTGFPSISMDKMKYEIRGDIILHIMRELDSHRRLRSMEASLKNEIYAVLWDKADGM